MNSIHDMGGMHGFGPVEPEPNEPVFHGKWEGRVHAMQNALRVLGLWGIDDARATQERLPPRTYLAVSYYERWLLGLTRQLKQHDLVSEDEIKAGKALVAATKPARPLSVADVEKGMTRGNFNRPPRTEAKFRVGDRVRTINSHPTHHTRLPRYARDKLGVIDAVRGCHVYPDSVTTGAGEDPQWLYTVVFSGRELWGDETDPNIKVSVEAFEPYLVRE